MEDPPKKFFRLAPGREVRLRYGYFIVCREVIRNAAGDVVELRCSYDPATHGGNAPDGRYVKGAIHWVSAADAVPAQVRLYNKANMGSGRLRGLPKRRTNELPPLTIEPAADDEESKEEALSLLDR